MEANRVHGMTPNLICEGGHFHWSPTPDVFAERLCFSPVTRRKDGLPTVDGKCKERLHLLPQQKWNVKP